ncbi:MAG: glucose-6-phosphate dehydrogenase [Gammaproteobacteria bacterium]
MLVIFGATGDLAQRMLLPALHGLDRDGLLPEALRIIGCARSNLDREAFRAQVAKAIARQTPAADCTEESVRRLLERIDYVPVDLSDDASMAALADRVAAMRTGDVLFHLSTAPRWYGDICAALGRAGLSGEGTRVMMEKPIGHDFASSCAINRDVSAVFDESRVYRVDHYLGKEGVQNLLALRFGNALFEPLWNARHIEQVQITVAETVGVEGRAGYYDESGAMRDMVQNHLLQLVCLTAMEPPSQFDPSAVRNEKIKVLRSLRPIRGADIATHSVSGQYSAGAVDSVAVPGYSDELGKASRTETFVALRAHIDNWRWSGVPFYLRTGKRMPRRCSEICLQFRAVPHSIFANGGAQAQPNALVIHLQPEEHISLHLMNKAPGLDRGGLKLAQVALDLDLNDAFEDVRRRSAYERLYMDAIEGDGTLFVRRDEVETAWQWVDDILSGWRESEHGPKTYPAGTWGPSSAVTLTERYGHSWRE